MKKISTLTLALMLTISLIAVMASCSSAPNQTTPTTPPTTSETPVSETPAEQPAESSEAVSEQNNNQEAVDLPNPIATIEMENGGKIVVELMPQYAPNTVNNFVTLAESGFYDGVSIHRIVPGFVIQGGDPDGTGGGGPGYAIKGEFIENGFSQNLLSHTRGVISMARTAAPNSAGSQFFIVLDDAAIPSLDAKYAGFGMVLEGMDVVDAIAASETNPMDAPVNPVIIKTITIDKQGVESWPAPEKIAE